MRPAPDVTPDRAQVGDRWSPGAIGTKTLSLVAALRAGFVAVVILAGCSGDDGDVATAARDTAADTSATTSAEPTTTIPPDDEEQPDAACGVALAEVQALLPPTSGVTESSTPDPGRCNFTWDDGGPRGIDVATVPGGRSAFDVPAGYELLDGFGDEAYASTTDGRASAFAFLGDDLYAVDVVADGTGATEAEVRGLCLQLLDLILD